MDIEYTLTLTTGEIIQICEFDKERYSNLNDSEFLENFKELLDLCTKCSREVIEQAKRGYDRPLLSLIGKPPVGCLIKVNPPICYNHKMCAMYKKNCTTKSLRKNKPDFPVCFEFNTDKDCDSDGYFLLNQIIHSWRNGRYVILIL